MSTEIYVGNLSRNTTEAEIRDLFTAAGEISEVTIMLDSVTGLSKGFGFVIMKNFIAAKEAIEHFNGSVLDGRKLLVKKAGEHIEQGQVGIGGGSLRNRRQGGRGRI